MGDMKCNEDTINPSYIEKKMIEEDQNMIQPTEKKERKDCFVFCFLLYFSSAVLERIFE
jgi:hypothetical protein